MRSDKHNRTVNKNSSSTKRKRRDTMNEDFLAEFRNMENNEDRTTSHQNHNNNDKKIKKEKPKKNKKVKKNGKKRRIWPKVLVVLLLLISVGVAGAYFFIDAQIAKFDHVDTTNEDFNIDEGVAEQLSGYRNIAILGVDAREGEDPEKCRTDAIIIATINEKTGAITLTSVMRDTYLLMSDVNGDDLLDKVTHAHAFGGPMNTVRMLNQSLDLNIEEFVVMDWNSVVDTVDAMGGITVDVQENEIADLNKWGPETAENTGKEWTEITETGEQRIDGVQAATYCRIRKTSGGDPGRTNRMKKVMTALFEEAKKHPTRITEMTDKVLPEIKTNMTTSNFMSLMPKILSFKIDNSIAYPYNYWGGIINGKWLAVPTTLQYNVEKLHEELFEQSDYNPSNTVKKISQSIINQSGVSQGNDGSE